MGLSVELTKNLGGFSLDVSWEIGNELAVLFGYSGAGKSMTLQLAAGLLDPDSGKIRAGEKVLFDSSGRVNLPPRTRPFGYVFQDLALFPHMSVRGNIHYGAAGMNRDEKEERATGLIGTFYLRGLENNLPSQISGGQRQRVAFARALMRRPEALLLDEPFSALDRPLRLDMRDLLRDIRSEFRIPVVLVTHDIQEACSLADRMIVYSQGRVVQSGSPIDIIEYPSSEDVRRLVAPENFTGETRPERRYHHNLDFCVPEKYAGNRSLKGVLCNTR